MSTCRKCLRWTQIGMSNWGECSIPSQPVSIPVRVLDADADYGTTVTGMQDRPGGQLFKTHADYGCQEFAKASRVA